MQELEKILEEIDEIYVDDMGCGVDCNLEGRSKLPCHNCYECIKDVCKEIIRKHMNDGWITVEKEWPPFGQRLQATILHHEWVSDYDSAWVPEEEKIHHAAYTEVCEIYPSGAMWCYNCAEDDYHSDVAYIEPAKDMNGPVAEIIAWQPLPEPYIPRNQNKQGGHSPDWRTKLLDKFDRRE